MGWDISHFLSRSAQNLSVTSRVAQRKGSCWDFQNPASPGLTSCFLSLSHTALLSWSPCCLSTPGAFPPEGLCTAVRCASAALTLYLGTALSLLHCPSAQMSPSQ